MNFVRRAKLEVGKIYRVSTVEARPPLSETYTPYPWGTKSTQVPVRVLADYPEFYVCEVLEHSTPFTPRSKPYTITIDRFALKMETFKAWEEVGSSETTGYVDYDYTAGNEACQC